MCESVVLKNPENLQFVLNHFKTQEVSKKALGPYMLGHVSGC